MARQRVEAFQWRIGRQCVQIEAVEKVAFDIPDATFYAAFFVWATWRAGDGTSAKVAAKVLEAGIEDRRTSQTVCADCGLHIVHDEGVGNALEVGEGVGQPRQDVLQAFLQEAFDVDLPGVAEHHAQEAQAAACGSDKKAFIRTPIHLCRLAGSKVQGLVGTVLPGTDLAHVVAQDAATSAVASFLELLIDLHRGEVGLFNPVLDGAFEGLKFAQPWA